MEVLRKNGLWIAAIVIILVLPQIFETRFALTMLNQIGVLIIFALAYNMLLGQAGMLSFGHAVYYGLAGYCAAHYMKISGGDELTFLEVVLQPILGGIVGLFFGILIGFVSTRRAGTTFAMISLGFAELATALALIFIAFFNGEEGVNTDRWVEAAPAGITFGPNEQVYYLVGFWCLVATIAMFALTRTPFGRMSNAVRDNPERVEFIGYSTHRVRWLSFALSSFFAGTAGALHAVNFEHVGFETVGVAQSGLVLFMVYIGGAGNFAGPILGAILVAVLRSNLSGITEAWLLYLGVIFMAIVMFAPGGLAGLITMHAPIWGADFRLFRNMVLPYLAGFASLVVACIGYIGIIELTYFLSTRPTAETMTTLAWTEVDAAGFMPWFISIATAAIGTFLCFRTFPLLAASYNAALEAAKARFAA